ncbi:probable NADH dehydrogenase [ubiquinone] 1 alpha subcomplex subunit 12 [Artemia franciscana]|uniref:probable NADH dehydrogenase [ubiquinone] 1 alpha subcomplex subunit 12 n=1 Tax=Artemia franciscana TaxID=6661 RepID=UPI0032DA9E37
MANIVSGTLEKVGNFFRMLKQNGGIIGSTKKLFYTDDLKDGTLIGVDKYGNKYFENKRYFVCRSRWVQYNEDVGLNYDGSQIPAEWYGWMHYKTDIPPTVRPPVNYKWMADHTENYSGTDKAWTPYSTTKPKIQPWKPPKKDVQTN